MLNVVVRCGRRHHDRHSPLVQIAEQRASSRKRRTLVSHPQKLLVLGIAQEVAELPLDVGARERRDDLIAAHTDVTVDTPDRHSDLVPAKGAKPPQRVLIVRVDERPVEIEQRHRSSAAQFKTSRPSSRLRARTRPEPRYFPNRPSSFPPTRPRAKRPVRDVGDVVFKVGEYPYYVEENDALELARRVREQAGDDPLSDAIAAAVYIEQAVEAPAEMEYPDAMPGELSFVRQALENWGMTPATHEPLPESLRRLRLALDAEQEDADI